MDPSQQKLARKLGDTKLAEALVKAGLRNPGQIRRASDEALEAVKGVGPATRASLRKKFAKRG